MRHTYIKWYPSMPTSLSGQLVVAISSRALFNLDDSHAIFEQHGIAAYQRYQIDNEGKLLSPGVAFPLVCKLLSLTHPETKAPLVEVILLSRNSADTGLRVFNSIRKHNLSITRAVFTNGESPYNYVTAFGAHLFLSANPSDVRQALEGNCAAAAILPGAASYSDTKELRIAFDGDAVLFSDDAERIFQQQGLDAFVSSEQDAANIPLPGGPFKGFLQALHQLQTYFAIDNCPIRTALVTARNAPAHERVIKTLRSWRIRIDEALFLGGLPKGEFLDAFGADIFFDDQLGHCESARPYVAAGHVLHGVANE